MSAVRYDVKFVGWVYCTLSISHILGEHLFGECLVIGGALRSAERRGRLRSGACRLTVNWLSRAPRPPSEYPRGQRVGSGP